MLDAKSLFETLHNYAGSWPVIIYVLAASFIYTIALRGLQFRYFAAAWRYLFSPTKISTDSDKVVHMTSLQAFISTLSANLGNGSIAGMATAVYMGGPGSAFWVLVIGIFLMVIRFAEVYLSTYYANTASTRAGFGGPMLYLRNIPGGYILSPVYAFITLIFGLTIGNGVQTNSISTSLQKTWHVPIEISAVALLIFVFYIVSGGAARIARVSERLVPVKVGTFFISAFAILIYHYKAIVPSLCLIWESAFHETAIAGAAAGFAIQQAMQYGIIRSIFATETGLGTAGILFGSTGSEEPIKDGIMSMLSTFISTLVCFLIALCILVSGVLPTALSATGMEEYGMPLTISCFNTVFGEYGGWIVTFLSISFGAGVLVSYAYIAREVWLFLTGGRLAILFNVVYCAIAFIAALVKSKTVWELGDIIVAVMLFINLYGLVYLIPVIRRALAAFEGTRERTND